MKSGKFASASTMKIRRTVSTIIIVVVTVLGIPLLYLFSKIPAVTLSASEKELVGFNAQQVIVSQAKGKAEYSGLESPVRPLLKANSAAADSAKKSESASVSRLLPVAAKKAESRAQPVRQPVSGAGLPSVSMVYSDGMTMMAIVDGHVVRDGALIGNIKIVKIEQKRVLMTVNGKNIWIDVN